MWCKNISNRDGNLFFRLFLLLVRETKTQPSRHADVFQLRSVQFKAACHNASKNQSERTAGCRGDVQWFKAHLYRRSPLLSNVAGLKSPHPVSAAWADHPLGPLIFFTDADELAVKNAGCARFTRHAGLLLSAPPQPWLRESSGRFGRWWHFGHQTLNDGVSIGEAYEP